MNVETTYTAFLGFRRLASGPIRLLLLHAKGAVDRAEPGALLIFDDQTGGQVDFDFRGSPDEVLGRLKAHPLFRNEGVDEKPGPTRGRPRLGVVCREVSLLPRHWEWLEQQPNGISAAIRRLVDDARKANPEEERRRVARAAANRFMTALAGNLPGFEEATRALFAGNADGFEESTREWPSDVRAYAQSLAQAAFRPGA